MRVRGPRFAMRSIERWYRGAIPASVICAFPLISRSELAQAFSVQVKQRLRVTSALGFPSKTSAEIAPDHLKLSHHIFGPTTEQNVQIRANIALSLYWCYFLAALRNGGNRFPLPAPALIGGRTFSDFVKKQSRLCDCPPFAPIIPSEDGAQRVTRLIRTVASNPSPRAHDRQSAPFVPH